MGLDVSVFHRGLVFCKASFRVTCAGTFAAVTSCTEALRCTAHHLLRLAPILSRSPYPPLTRSISCPDALLVVASWKSSLLVRRTVDRPRVFSFLLLQDSREKKKGKKIFPREGSSTLPGGWVNVRVRSFHVASNSTEYGVGTVYLLLWACSDKRGSHPRGPPQLVRFTESFDRNPEKR